MNLIKKCAGLCFIVLATMNVCLGQPDFYDVNPGNGNGIRFWVSDLYKIHMGIGAEYQYGPVTEYSIKTNMTNAPGWGWSWGVPGATPVAAINISGEMQIAGGFKANNIFTSGRVVIGTGTYSGTSANGISLGYDQNVLEFVNTDYGSGYAAKIYGVDHGNGLTSLRFGVKANSTTWTDAMFLRIADSNGGGKLGFLGVGTNDPQARAHVHEPLDLGPLQGNNVMLFSVSGTAPNHFAKNLWLLRDSDNPPGQNQWWNARLHDGISIDYIFATPGENTRTWWERDPMNNIQSWGHADQTYVTISGGNVGIGTINPDTKLAVKGVIHSEEVRVDLNVPAPDYVFENDYNLLPLPELEAYVKQNKHLPEIPSAKEMEANGLNLKEMNLLLLKKVEELTIHLIEENKRLNSQQNQISLLQTEIKELKKELYERK